MARKQRIESIDVKPPEFDRKQYIRRELLDSKLSFIVLPLAIVLGIVSGYLFSINVAVAAVVGLAGMLAIPFIFKFMGIDLKKELLSDEKKKLTEDERKAESRGYLMKNVGQMGMYFLTWLAIFVLMLNMPITDVSPPAYLNVKAKIGSDGWVYLNSGQIELKTNGTASGKKVTLNALVTDNTGVGNVTFVVDDVSYKPTQKGDEFEFSGLAPNSPMNVRIEGKDTLGHSSSTSFKVIITVK